MFLGKVSVFCTAKPFGGFYARPRWGVKPHLHSHYQDDITFLAGNPNLNLQLQLLLAGGGNPNFQGKIQHTPRAHTPPISQSPGNDNCWKGIPTHGPVGRG